jgi:hypothetical protein
MGTIIIHMNGMSVFPTPPLTHLRFEVAVSVQRMVIANARSQGSTIVKMMDTARPARDPSLDGKIDIVI